MANAIGCCGREERLLLMIDGEDIGERPSPGVVGVERSGLKSEPRPSSSFSLGGGSGALPKLKGFRVDMGLGKGVDVGV